MSYDVNMIKENQEEIRVGKYTYNISSMYKKAMNISLHDLNGLLGENVLPILLNGIIEMLLYYPEYRKLNPKNGWGNYEGALNFLIKIYLACKDNPNWIVEIS